MNLYELNLILNQLIDEDDPNNNALIEFYIKKREELIEEISKEINKILHDPLI